MKFKQFIEEMEGVPEKDPNINNVLSDIKKILQTMSEDEVDEFGEWLYDEMYDDNDGEWEFDIEEVIEMVSSLDSNDLNYVYSLLSNDTYIDDDETGIGHTEGNEDGEITEKKFFKKKKNVLNREKKKNRVQRRKDKKLRKKDYRKHKAKIKRKQKKYLRKVKRNPNKVRHHR